MAFRSESRSDSILPKSGPRVHPRRNKGVTRANRGAKLERQLAAVNHTEDRMFKMSTGVAAFLLAGLAVLACTDESGLNSGGGGVGAGQMAGKHAVV